MLNNYEEKSTKGTQGRQIDCLTGLKGICAIIVVLLHFVTGFFPTMYNGDISLQHLGIEAIISNSPLFVLINGQFVVYIFWAISGFLISYSWYSNHSIDEMRKKAIKKYLSFLGPAAISLFIAYIIMKLGLYYNIEASHITGSTWLSAFYDFKPNLFVVLKQIFYDCFFTGDTTYNAPLWTMTFELMGSLMIILILVLFGDIKKRYYIYSFLIVVTGMVQPRYMVFLFGAICADLMLNSKINIKTYIVVIIFAIGVLGGGFPSGHETRGIYELFPFKNGIRIYCVSAALILWSVINSTWIQKILSARLFVYLGKRSLYIYIFHFPILFSLCSYIFIKLYQIQKNYIFSASVSGLVSFICIFIVANMSYYFMEKTCKQRVNKIVKWIVSGTENRKSE